MVNIEYLIKKTFWKEYFYRKFRDLVLLNPSLTINTIHAIHAINSSLDLFATIQEQIVSKERE